MAEHAPNASSSNSTGLAPDCLLPSITVSIPPSFTPVNLNPPSHFSFAVRSLIRFPLIFAIYRSLCVVSHQPFGDAAGLVRALALDRDVPNQLPAVGDLFESLQDGARPNLRSGGDRRWEADFVQSVVDTHLDRQVDFDRLRHQLTEQRQRQKTVRDRGSVRRFGLGPLDIDVNPLVVARGVGEKIDALVRDFEPIAHGDLLPRQRMQLFQTAYLSCRHKVS